MTTHATRAATAGQLIASLTDGVLLWQVACEFVAASRKLAAFGFTHEQAWREVHRLRSLWMTKLPSWEIAERTEELMKQYSFSFWDALIVAACLESGISRLYSEDFDNSAAATGLEVINPLI
ncbi:MAG: PIN domain-containing protein [Pyrinomonadaceae bacterium]